MSAHDFDDEDVNEDLPQKKEPTPVKDLPYYETLRIVLEPYRPARGEQDATDHFTSAEIISQIEQHHGVPQGVVGKSVTTWVRPDDFVRAMRHLGFREVNGGGMQLYWVMTRK